jgi:aryl-alcohol dehydrogenase-like predicted oxidoreductase
LQNCFRILTVTSTTIETRPIPSSGEELPIIGLGTWQTFDVGRDESERRPLEEVLYRFVELGGRLVDSSPMYGRSEEVVGAIATRLGLRERLFLATKVWTTGKRAGLAQLDESARLLRSPKLDLLQVHNLLDVDTQLENLRAWKEEGRVRYIGVSHYTAWAYAEVARVLRREKLDFLQINYSILEPEAENEILPLAAERGLAVIVNRPLGGGAGLRRVAARRLPSQARELGCESWAELFLKWILANPQVTCVIPATGKRSHLERNMRAGSGPLPDAADRRAIAEAIR